MQRYWSNKILSFFCVKCFIVAASAFIADRHMVCRISNISASAVTYLPTSPDVWDCRMLVSPLIMIAAIRLQSTLQPICSSSPLRPGRGRDSPVKYVVQLPQSACLEHSRHAFVTEDVRVLPPFDRQITYKDWPKTTRALISRGYGFSSRANKKPVTNSCLHSLSSPH